MALLLKVAVSAGILATGSAIYFSQYKLSDHEWGDQSGTLRPPIPPEDMGPGPYIPSDIGEMHQMGYLEQIASAIGFKTVWSWMPDFVHKSDLAFTMIVDDWFNSAKNTADSATKWAADAGLDFFGGYFSSFFTPEVLTWILFGVGSFFAAYIAFVLI